MTPTSGGSAAGSVATARNSRRPGNSNRPRRNASGTPIASDANTEATEMTMLVRSASRSAGLAMNSRQCPSPFSKLPATTAAFG